MTLSFLWARKSYYLKFVHKKEISSRTTIQEKISKFESHFEECFVEKVIGPTSISNQAGMDPMRGNEGNRNPNISKKT